MKYLLTLCMVALTTSLVHFLVIHNFTSVSLFSVAALLTAFVAWLERGTSDRLSRMEAQVRLADERIETIGRATHEKIDADVKRIEERINNLSLALSREIGL